MKKILVTLIVIFYVLTSFSQESSTAISYKPVSKSFTAEVNFNPFSSSPISINYIRARRFISDLHALRMGFSVAVKNQTQIEDVNQSTFDINLRPGYEWHFAGTDRLSPYLGIDVDFAIKSSTFTDNRNPSQFPSPYSKISGAWDNNGTERGFTRVGANILGGIDYYVIKKLYLGVEIGYGFQLINFQDITFTSRSSIAINPIPGGSNFQLGPNFNSSIRLGFVF